MTARTCWRSFGRYWACVKVSRSVQCVRGSWGFHGVFWCYGVYEAVACDGYGWSKIRL